ncbi:MAG TPA: DoxX family protein [Ginsengibacter sp.]|nr:DoxX family protein [Chitinophagaceae bacterium]MCZ2396590.1 DoxX family protein [Chitinophagales bacterium]HRN73217.1 DoxX family protein [Ginsengibacter sp.]MCW5915673.1 DoxX family protein [Chitinophagaceae bacterium]HRP17685.1 DoxX family protein [Ginsengibacter sp.]
MKKLFSVKYSHLAFNIGMLVLRVVFGLALMANHGYRKLTNFPTMKEKFMNFMNLGSTVSLSLITFAEFFCGFLLILGMFTRLAAIPVLIGMVVAFAMAHGAVFSEGEMPLVFACIAFLLLMVGPGKFSIDGAISK